MKVELIKEESYLTPDWWFIRIDDKYLTGSYNEASMQELYERILADPKFFETGRKTIMKSQEIVVPLEEEILTKNEKTDE